MTALIIGPSGSGKSAYAEKLAASMPGGPLIYIATMLPYGDEGKARVERHRTQREKYGFTTIEAPLLLSKLAIDSAATVLLEDVSNLLANAIFMENRDSDSVLEDIRALRKKCTNLIMVSIGGLTDNGCGDAETAQYIRSLNILNRELEKTADKTVRTGEWHELD